MKLEKGIITNRQLAYTLIAFLQSAALTINFEFSLTKQSTWIVVIVGYALMIPAILMYLGISRKVPGKNLIQINDQVFGGVLGKVVSVVYLWFFLQNMINYLFFFNSFWITFIMPETPRSVFLIMLAVTSAMAVRNGIETIARCCFLFAAIVWLTTIMLTILLLGDMKLANLLPVFSVPFKDFVQSTHVLLAITLGDSVVFLMLFPYVEDKQKLKKPMLAGLSISVLQLMIVVLHDTLTLGQRTANATSASFLAAMQVDIAEILTRMDILVAISLLITIFVKVTVFYYAAVLGTAQILNLRSYKGLITPIGVMAVTIAMVMYQSNMEQAYVAEFVFPFSAIIYEFLLPAVTLTVIVLQRRAKKRKEAQAL